MKQLFLFLIAAIPFQVAFSFVPGFDFASGRILILGLFAWWLARGILQKKILLPYSPITVALAGFLLLATFSVFGAANPAFAMRKLIFLLNLALLYLVSAYLWQAYPDLRRPVIRTLGASATLVAIIGIIQVLAQFPFGSEAVAEFWGAWITPIFSGTTFTKVVLENQSWFVDIYGRPILRAISVFPDPHTLGLYLGMALPFALWQTVEIKNFIPSKVEGQKSPIRDIRPSSVEGQAQGKKIKNLYGITVIIIITAILLTFSRGAYLGLVASLASFTIFSWRLYATRTRSLLSVFYLLLAITLVPWNPIGERFAASFDASEGSAAQRIEIWREALQLFREHPFTGVGLGNYAYVIDPLAGYRSPINAHSAYLEVAVETGIFGLVFFVALILWPIFQFITHYALRITPYALPAIAGIVFFAVHSLVETTIWNVTNLALLMLLLALAATPRSDANIGANIRE